MTVSQGIDPRVLRAGYRECGRLTRRFGTTYFWGAALLPRRQRKHVYAVYALCRLADVRPRHRAGRGALGDPPAGGGSRTGG